MIKPLQNRILIKVSVKSGKLESGIFLPCDYQEQKYEGIVVETASKIVKKGDKVLFSKYGPVDFKIDNEPHVIVEEVHLLALLE